MTGSSRGLGLPIAARLAHDGFAVAANGSDPSRTAAAADAITKTGGIAQAFPADVTDEAAVSELIASVQSRLGVVDTIVFNATGP